MTINAALPVEGSTHTHSVQPGRNSSEEEEEEATGSVAQLLMSTRRKSRGVGIKSFFSLQRKMFELGNIAVFTLK